MAIELSGELVEIRDRALPVLRRYGARRAGVFGSAARGELRNDSDIDLLVELGPELSLLAVARLARELEEAIGRPVDLVEYASLKPRIRERILAEEVAIL